MFEYSTANSSKGIQNVDANVAVVERVAFEGPQPVTVHNSQEK